MRRDLKDAERFERQQIAGRYKNGEWGDDDDKCCFYYDGVEAHDHVGVKNRNGEDEEDGS